MQIPAIIFAVMFLLNIGPWQAARFTTPEALISLVQDESQREKVVDQLPALIEAAITSRDENVRDQAADLTLRVVEEAMKKSSAKTSDKNTVMNRVTKITEEYRKTGFVYDKLLHLLTNAIRNLNLATQISELNISAEEKLVAHGKIATVGEAIREKLITDNQIRSLLIQLPTEAQPRPGTKKVSVPRLSRFIELLNQVFASLQTKLSADQQRLAEQLEQEARKGGLTDPRTGTNLKIQKEIKIPNTPKGLLELPRN